MAPSNQRPRLSFEHSSLWPILLMCWLFESTLPVESGKDHSQCDAHPEAAWERDGSIVVRTRAALRESPVIIWLGWSFWPLPLGMPKATLRAVQSPPFWIFLSSARPRSLSLPIQVHEMGGSLPRLLSSPEHTHGRWYAGTRLTSQLSLPGTTPWFCLSSQAASCDRS